MPKREQDVRSQLARRIERWITENDLTNRIMSDITGRSMETVRRWRDPKSNSWPSTLDIAQIQTKHDCSHFCLSPCCETCKIMSKIPNHLYASIQAILKSIKKSS